MILPDLAKNVMLRFIIKFKESAMASDNAFEVENPRKKKKRLNDRISSEAPAAPAKQNERNFFFIPIFIICKINI